MLRHLGLLVTLPILLAEPQTVAGAAGPQSVHLQLVLDASESNYSLIKTLECELREVERDTSVSQSTTTVRTLDSGATVRLTRTPRIESRLKIWAKGDLLRVDRQSTDRGKRPIEQLLSLRGVTTQYVPCLMTAWRRRNEDVPASMPYDPRTCGTDNNRLTLLKRIEGVQECKVQRFVREGRHIIQITDVRGGKTQTLWEFSSAARYLPTAFRTFWDDHSLLQSIDYEYTPVLDDQALLLKRVRRRFYSQGVARDPSSPAWRQETLREVVGEVRVNQALDPAIFELDLPRGTRINDSTDQVAYGRLDPVEPRSRVGLAANIAGLVLLASLVALKAYRRHTNLR